MLNQKGKSIAFTPLFSNPNTLVMRNIKISLGYGKTFVEIALNGISEGTIKHVALFVIFLTALTFWFWLFLQGMMLNQY